MTELEKMHAVKEKSQVIGEFLEWFQNEKKFVIARRDCEDKLYPYYVNIEELLAAFFGINLKKAEEEKRAILEEIRSKS